MSKITGKVKAWLPGHYGPEVLQYEPQYAISSIAFADHDMSTSGWTLIGEAEISVEVVNEDEIILNKVSSLRAEKDAVLAKAQHEATRIEEKIQQLLAITFKPESVEN